MADYAGVREVVSNGDWQGDTPIQFALPLLIIQLTLVLLVTRSLAWLLKPLRQPRVIAEVLGGVLLGPTGLGHFHSFTKAIFPEQSLMVLETVASIGLLFFLFIVGLELDLDDIRKSGRKALVMAMAGIGVPLIGGVGVASVVRDAMADGASLASLAIFMGVPISITAFPVMVRILAERKLLGSEVATMVVPAAAINDVCAWILLALGVALAGSHNNTPLTPLWVLLSGTAFAGFMVFAARPSMSWIIRHSTTHSELPTCIALVGVLISGFITDTIGLHPLFGAFMFGLIIPKQGRFAHMVSEKVEDFVTVLMLPLFFASSGLKTDLTTINSAKSFGFLLLLLATAACGKMGGTWVAAIAQGTDKKTALVVGVLMNTKGLVELIILNVGKDLKVLNEQIFAILVLMCLLTTFIVTPLVMALYKPAQVSIVYTARSIQSLTPKQELRILACIHGSRTIPSIVNFLEMCRRTKKRPTKPYILQFIELSERPSSLIMARKAANACFPSISSRSSQEKDNIFVTFEACGELSKVKVKSKTVVSEIESMHEDICRTAAERQSSFILLPYHRCNGGDGELDLINPLLRKVNQRVLKDAPCSVGIVIDRGPDLWMFTGAASNRNTAVFFFGGPDDREALLMGSHLAAHPGVTLTIIRFLPGELPFDDVHVDSESLSEDHSSTDSESENHSQRAIAPSIDEKREKQLDRECLDSVWKQHHRSALYEELRTDKAVEGIIAIAKMKRFNMFLVGRGRHGTSSSFMAAFGMTVAEEVMELGPLGGLLAGDTGIWMDACVVVVQQYDSRLMPKNVDVDDGENEIKITVTKDELE